MIGGGTPKTGVSRYWSGDIVWITPKDLGKLKGNDIYDSCKKISSEGLKESSARLLPKGTVVLSSRAPIGYVSIAGVPLATNQGCRSFICDDRKIYNKFLYYYLVTKREYLDQLGGGSTFREVSGSKLKEVEIPLPPLTEQKKIVAKLEKMLAKIKEAKRLCAEARAATQSLFSAELHKIFEEGKKKGWEEKMIDEIAGTVQYGYTASAREKGSARLLRITDIQNGGVSWESVPFCECEDLGKYKLYDGDIVFARTGATVGKSYLINNPPENAIFASYLIRVGTDRKQCSPELLYYFFQSMDYWDQITEHAVGGAQPNVNGSKLKKVKIFLPSLVEQEKIVTRLDKLSAKLKKLEEHQKSTALDLARLEQAILQKAFSRDNLL